MQLNLKIRVILAIRVVYLSPRISRIARMLLCFKIRVIRVIRVVFLPLPLNRCYSVLFEIGVAA